MKTILSLLLAIIIAALGVAYGLRNGETPVTEQLPTAVPAASPETDTETELTDLEKALHLSINDTAVCVEWEDNASVEALIELASSQPLTVAMSMYGGFEQVGALGTSLPRDDRQTTTDAGDIVLYAGNQIVVFYGSNSWAYTRLGRIADKSSTELRELLGNGDVTLTLTWN